MSRAIWKGSISFGLVSIPVTLHPGERRHDLSFHMLDSRDMSPVHYVRVNERTGQEVPWEEIVKGYEYEKGAYVVVSDDDFRRANIEATETVDILDFVKAQEVDTRYFDAPYYLQPRKEGRKAYALLRETLRRTGYIAVGTVVIKTRQHLAAVLVLGDDLVLELLRFPHELRDATEIDVPGADLSEIGVTDKELEMAEHLVETMAGRWNPAQYRDKYRDDLLKLIKKKASRGDIEAPVPVAKPAASGAQVVDIMGLLKRSIEEAQSGVSEPAPARARTARAAKKGG